ncbi:hypothetical protein [Curtobacterium sp. VKM Ac-1376]|uniref:hypothetical protein n=1 Tax=Curtobacterium sp. VKM Ac-1376 TaxID=123312 RepID=UPI00188BBBBA|nr:hypothetical protein [Curtobacterium sp. VKM Ac-1376]MBF4615497.1 hypothetical protein [Curtobacterium sp. VKM Ac-1376]
MNNVEQAPLLIIAAPGLVDGLLTTNEQLVASVLTVGLPTAAVHGLDHGAPNTLMLDWRTEADEEVLLRSADSEVRLPFGRLFERMLPGAAVRDAAGSAGYHGPLVPQSVVVPADHGRAHVWTRLRYSDDDAVFIRVTTHPVPFSGTADPAFIAIVRSLNETRHLFLNNHQCYYTRRFPGEELEHKYLLDGGDIWTATLDVYNAIRSGLLTGFVPEYHDEFQTWDYENHLHEIEGPGDEQGYVSFIPLVGGGYTVKRKWFGADAFRRGERMSRENETIDDFVGYVADRMGVIARPLPPFRRVRYDVNFESLATGHVYGIFFDQSTIDGAPHHRMMQCELEYLRTRSVLPQNDEDVLREMESIAEWLESVLGASGFKTQRGTYSKLSFLKQAVRDDAALGAVYA